MNSARLPVNPARPAMQDAYRILVYAACTAGFIVGSMPQRVQAI